MGKNPSTVSRHVLDLLEREGCRTIFGVPGAYSIHFVDTCASDNNPFDFILSSHEGGAAFMAQGYSHVTRSLGCAVTTAGPAALNAVTAMASAKADGDRVLLIHGENPKPKRGRGALQDATCFDCEVKDVLAPVVHRQFVLDSAADFTDRYSEISRALAAKSSTTHLMLGADVFPADVSLPEAPLSEEAAPPTDSAGSSLRPVVDLLLEAESMLVLAGHGVYQANGLGELAGFLDEINAPTMVSARAAACVDPEKPYFIGQHSIFSHERVSRWMQCYGGKNTSLLLVIGSSLGEFSSNGWAEYLRAIPRIVHVNTDRKSFGRLGKHSLDVAMDARCFLQALRADARLAKASEAIRERNNRRLEEFRSRNSSNLYSRLNEDLASAEGESTGQRAVHAVSEALARSLPRDTVLNVVADTGSAKLYAAHYMRYRPGARSIMNSGAIDCLGFGLSAAIGAAVGSRDIGENALTVCFAGDGGMLMNNELNTLAANASLRGLRLLIIVLNDASLSYVHQGFAAVMGRALDATRFQRQVDFSMMASAFGISSAVIYKASELTPAFLSEILARQELPFLLDCRISNKVVGPGLSRYNQVRSILGKPPLSPSEMVSCLE